MAPDSGRTPVQIHLTASRQNMTYVAFRSAQSASSAFVRNPVTKTSSTYAQGGDDDHDDDDDEHNVRWCGGSGVC
eukprot:8731063-Karenia_brevis.AAC.1